MSPINTIQASAVPVLKNTNNIIHKHQNKKNSFKKNHKKKFKKKFKQLKNTQTHHKGNSFMTLLITIVVAWYLIALVLLTIALVFGITPLLIAAIILLALPIALVLIFGIIFLILLLTSTGDWC